MKATSDPFLDLVERVAHDLGQAGGDPPGGAELAAEAGFSRFHYDRLIQAVSGETPARFLARILLERAAYRMTTSERTLLEVATEAGFGSHAAFTRAFRRAYGVAPSAWRERPSRYQLETPNGVHFHPPGGLRIPARDGEPDGAALVDLVRHHALVVTAVVERVARLDDAQLDEPTIPGVEYSDPKTLRRVVSRLIGQMAMWCAAMDDAEYDFAVEQDESVLSMRSRCARIAPEFVAAVEDVVREQRLGETFVDAFCRPAVTMTFGSMVAHVLYFGGHHRLLATAQLARFGIDDLDHGDPKAWLNREVSGGV